ncbi:hypothetical protein MVEN_02162400 [Mycena venus]|uniref:Uncharacterized protein n=1 Tax=Mycena venus TaxID=2733690 RepID=A0A8H6X7S7_9AGAR|nr:hypothetical protein MVEN_02162400 [Mycena venus]
MSVVTLVLALGWLATASVAKELESQTVCNPVSGLCFEQFFNSELNVTVGFALPPKQAKEFSDEACSFPLPYGFAGVLLGDSFEDRRRAALSTPLPALTWYSDFTSQPQAETTSFSIEDCRAELATTATNDTLVPALKTPITQTFSPLTTWGHGGAQFIFRCRNCSVVVDYFAKHDKAKLTTVISTSYPIYLDDTLTLANLSLVGAQYQEFKLDTKAARFANYSSLLAAAGLL